MAIVEVRDLRKAFGDFEAVRGISFEVDRGEIFGFLGPNGAGKSTTIRMLCGLLAPSSGTAIVAGVDVVRDPEGVKRRLGYMSQRFSLYQDLSVDENLRLFSALYGLSGERFERRRAWALELLRLSGRERSRVGELPGGVRQSLALACALLHEPEVVFLDEPTGGVDPLMRRTFFDLIDEIAAAGTTVFLTTHFLDEAEYCNRCAFIAAGRLIALGTPEQLKRRLSDHVILELRTRQPRPVLAAVSSMPEVLEAPVFGAGVHAMGRAGVAEAPLRDAIVRSLRARGLEVPPIARVPPTLEDVFIRLASEAGS
ncbi:MAG TPA: ABC transporter ATP-binding protein [Vulgatibacter sp.]